MYTLQNENTWRSRSIQTLISGWKIFVTPHHLAIEQADLPLSRSCGMRIYLVQSGSTTSPME